MAGDERRLLIEGYEVSLDGPSQVSMPSGAALLPTPLLHLTPEGSALVWAVVDPDQPEVPRSFLAVGTGEALPDPSLRYVGRTQVADAEGKLTWKHLMDAGQPEEEGL